MLMINISQPINNQVLNLFKEIIPGISDVFKVGIGYVWDTLEGYEKPLSSSTCSASFK